MQIIHERKIHEYVEGKILAPKANRTNYKVERNTKKMRQVRMETQAITCMKCKNCGFERRDYSCK